MSKTKKPTEKPAQSTYQPEIGTYAYTARMMAEICPVDDDPDFWDRWKDEMKEGQG